MREVIYIDTSVLAKWYINESRSDDVEEYIRLHGPMAISDLTVVEMRSLLARRRREKSFNTKIEMEIFATFQEDVRGRFLVCHPFPDGWVAGAVNLMALLPDIPMTTLDALHIVIAKEIAAEVLVTADYIMAEGAEASGLRVVRF